MTPREIRFGLDGLTGLAVVTVGAALASLTWTLAGYSASSSPVSAAVGAYVPPSPAPDVTALINLPPFGKASLAPVAVAAGGGLVLHGVLLTIPLASSTVLIAVPGQDPVSYRMGEMVPAGGVIDRIGVDYVILRNGGQLLTLYFPDDPRAPQPAAPGAVNPAVPAPPPTPQMPAAAPATNNVDAMRAYLSSSNTSVSAPPPPAPPPNQNIGNGNGLIDRRGAAVTPQP